VLAAISPTLLKLGGQRAAQNTQSVGQDSVSIGQGRQSLPPLNHAQLFAWNTYQERNLGRYFC
jgi:hypothetical protein